MMFFERFGNRGIDEFARSEGISRSEAQLLAHDRAEAQELAKRQAAPLTVASSVNVPQPASSQPQPVEIPLMERDTYIESRPDRRFGQRVWKMAKEKKGYVIGGVVGAARFLGADVMPDDVEQTVDKIMHVAPFALGFLGVAADYADYRFKNSTHADSRVHRLVKRTKKGLQYGIVAAGGYMLGEVGEHTYDSFRSGTVYPSDPDQYSSSRYDDQVNALRNHPEDYETYPYNLGSNNKLDMTPDRVDRINDYQRELRHAAEQTGQYPHRFDVNIPEIPKIDEDCTNIGRGTYDPEAVVDRINDAHRIPGLKPGVEEQLAARSAVCQDLYDAPGEEYWRDNLTEKLEVARQAGVLRTYPDAPLPSADGGKSPVLVPEPHDVPVVPLVDPYDIDHLTAPNGAIIDGNKYEGWTYNGKRWYLVENGEKNIRLLISNAGGNPDRYTINQDRLAQLLTDDVWQWRRGKLPSTDEGYDLFHFSNGTRSIFDRLLNSMSLERLIDLKVVSPC